MEILLKLLSAQGVSGDEYTTSKLIIKLINERKSKWKVLPKLYYGDDFQDCILLRFGNPRTAVFAHIDTIGFMTRYSNELISVGGPEIVSGTKLVGKDSLGDIECRLIGEEDGISHDFPRKIDRGTCLSFKQNVRIDEKYIQAAYLDNRIGIYNALNLCENLEDGWVVFSTYEEHGGGSMPFLLKFIQENAPVKQALISDITWITEGVTHHNGVAISIRDRHIPRRVFTKKIIKLAEQSGIPFQIEVEGAGGSDGREVQFSPYPIDWCFIGAAEDNVHSPDEKVSLVDIESMCHLYDYLLANL